MKTIPLIKIILATTVIIVCKQSRLNALDAQAPGAQIIQTSLCDVDIETSPNHPLFTQLLATNKRITDQISISNPSAILDNVTLELIEDAESHIRNDLSSGAEQISLYEEILTYYQIRILDNPRADLGDAIQKLASHYIIECIPRHSLRYKYLLYEIPTGFYIPLYRTDRLVTRPNGILFIRCIGENRIRRVTDDEISVEAFCRLR